MRGVEEMGEVGTETGGEVLVGDGDGDGDVGGDGAVEGMGEAGGRSDGSVKAT